MPYCYACRNDKPATHAHFVEHGILAMRPPKRHITEIEALWDSMTDAQQARALEAGRQFLAAHPETDAPARADRASASRSARSASTAGKTGAKNGEEGAGFPWDLVGVGAVVLGVVGALFWKGRGA